MAPLATLDQFSALCPNQGSANPGGVALALLAATTAAERYCGRTFASDEATEYYDGNGFPELPLNRWPITSVAAVYLDLSGSNGQAPNAFPSTSLLTAGTNYYYDATKGMLVCRTFPAWWPVGGFGFASSPWGWPGLTRRGTAYNAWPKWPGCIKVQYTAGYAPIPYDLAAAVCAMAEYILIATPGGGMVTTSTSYIDVSAGSGFLAEQLARGNVPALGSSRAVLDSYRDIRTARLPF